MKTGRPPVVAVVGAANCTPEQAATAAEVGRLLAKRGAILVCGGRGGVMAAACRGARDGGGLTIGLLPGDDPAEGNPYLTVALPTGLGQARNTLVALAGQAVIAIGGGHGSLSEIALALKSGRRVIGMETWRATHPDGEPAAMLLARTPQEAIDLALRVDEIGS
jgi:uncharacterized protein (TIGR00725 family)